MSSPPHPLMHLGMTGWVELRHIPTAYWRRPSKETYPLKNWPPKAWRFTLTTSGAEPVEAAFVDMRRFGRVRLIDCPASDIRSLEPLSANGPDPVIDADIVTEKWLKEKTKGRAVPIKALLLDQAFLSGVGNWVGDEVLYQAGIHPAQRADSLSDPQVSKLHASLMYVTKTAVDVLAEWAKFPESWLFLHRWNKGKKDATNRTADGSKITYVTVGGRTTAVVEGKQKLVKRAKAENAELDESNEEEDPETVNGAGDDDANAAKPLSRSKQKKQPEGKKGQKRVAAKEPDEEDSGAARSKRKKSAKQDDPDTVGGVDPPAADSLGRGKRAGIAKRAMKRDHTVEVKAKTSAGSAKAKPKAEAKPGAPSKRRSTRLSNVDGI